MKGELVSFPTKDKLSLQGFFAKIKGKKAVIFLHGLGGSMGNYSMNYAILDACHKAGFSYLMFNSRGFGVVNRIYPYYKTGKSRTIGAAYEKFIECYHDIQASVNFLKKKGYDKIILIGHSTGCQKAAYYLSHKPDTKVKGVVFIAPCDDAEAETLKFGKKMFKKKVKFVRKLVKRHKGDKMVEGLSAKRLYSLFCGIESKMFDYTREKLEYISKIKVPMFVIFGANEKYVAEGKLDDRIELIKKSANIECDSAIVKRATHCFGENPKGLYKVMCGWLKKV